MDVNQEEEEEVEMSFEDFLVYSARIGEFDDVKLSLDDKVDPNYQDASGNSALRKLKMLLKSLL